MPALPLAHAAGGEERSYLCLRGERDRKGDLRTTLLLSAALLLTGCQNRSTLQVRVDLTRAAQAVARAPQPPVPEALPAQVVAVAPSAGVLFRVEPPAPTDALRNRRALALSRVEQQRTAVRQQLLQRRLQSLPELEARWYAELRAEYDTDRLRAERDAALYEAFQEYGRLRFPLLVALLVLEPGSDAHLQAQTQLEQHKYAWQQRERAIESAYQAALRRIDQEIVVRVSARRREFIRNAETEIQELLAMRPDPAEVYFPRPQTLLPVPTRKVSFPPLSITIPERTLSNAPHTANRRLRQAIIHQLAQEWAYLHNYTLTDDPRAPDYTEAFLRYLFAR